MDVVDVAAHGVMGALVSTVFFNTFKPTRQTSTLIILALALWVLYEHGKRG